MLTAVSPPAPPADGQSPLQPQATDPDALNRLISMLEKVLLQKSSLTSNGPVRGPTRRPGPRLPRIGGLHDKPCSLCQDAAHSAFIHCPDHRLCFRCHSPDHSRHDCPAFRQQSENSGEDSVDHVGNPPSCDADDLESLYESLSSATPSGKTAIFQSTQRLQRADSLFYTYVCAAGEVHLKAMIDSGSMSCSLSEAATALILRHCLEIKRSPADDIVVIGAGGHHVTPTAVYDLEVTIYGFKVLVPMLVIPGQTDDMIVGSNVLKVLIRLMKGSDGYWNLLAKPVDVADSECCQFLSLLANSERWEGGPMPDKVGTVKLRESVVLEPLQEHLVWGKLPASAPISVGSTVIVEATQSRARPRNVLVGRVITPLWGNRWVPLKLINPGTETVILKRNTKIADVSPCIAVEELSSPDKLSINVQSFLQQEVATRSPEQMEDVLYTLGLQDLNLKACEVSDLWKEKLLQLVESYETVFSRDKMDCGEATDIVHKISLVDEKPFCLPYRRVPPSQYEALRTVLSEMEERGIIRK